MTDTNGALAVNQLLGRLVYFHILFIEPSLSSWHVRNRSQGLCCRHDRPATDAVAIIDIDIEATPWSALTQIATDLGAQPCRDLTSGCCPVCRVRWCAMTIAQGWVAIEHRAYASDRPVSDNSTQQWSATIAERMASVFADQLSLHCGRRSSIALTSTPPAHRFPLTTELAQLWLDPFHLVPVISWLNHCTGLDDIARRLHQGSTL
ncbi:hypothetical protein ACGFIX_34030 [Nocardia salmonicida]|uniref:hypothetical protein n=1 Tax=Nocardia salmonicida TaxID=53431 RepID=UPI003710FE01